MVASHIARAKRRLRSEAWVIDAVKRLSVAQRLRRSMEVRRVRSLASRAGSPSAVLDQIVAKALEGVPPLNERTLTERKDTPDPSAVAPLPIDRARRVGVLAPLPVSGVEGGNERQWQSLTAALCDHGHDAELVGLISPESDLAEVLNSYAEWHSLDLSRFDVVISGKYPAFVARHPRHLRHLSHPLRGLYEHYPADLPTEPPAELVAGLDACGDNIDVIITWALDQVAQRPGDPAMSFPGPFARMVVQRLDALGRDGMLAESTMSETIAERSNYTDSGRSIAVIAPVTDLQQAATVAAGPSSGERRFLFTFGRMDNAKRFDLVIAAFDLARRLPGMKDVELVVAGSGPLEDELRAAAGAKVRFVGRVSDDALRRYLSDAVAVVLAPINEDFGLVASESLAAGSPVITTADSGGVAEQVIHERTGLIVHPKPSLLAVAIRALATDPQRAARMGRAAADSVRSTTWQPMLDWIDDVIEPRRRPRVLMLSTFPASPVASGGQRRVSGAAAGLRLEGWDVVILSLTNRVPPDHIKRRWAGSGIDHVDVGRSHDHLAADFAMASLVGSPIDDVAASVLWPSSPSFAAELDRQISHADIVVLAHPYLATALPDCDVPVVYDAHNVETDLKAGLFSESPGSAWVNELATTAEAAALARADLVAATSVDDLARLSDLAPSGSPLHRCVAPNPVALDLVAARTNEEKQAGRRRFHLDAGTDDDGRPLVVFIGSDHPPNRAAARRCAALAAVRPDLHVVVAGSVRCPAGAATVIGPFANSDLRRLLAMADIVLNPVEEGSGTSLKLIDALSVGVPIVSTAHGARGLPSPAAVLWLSESDPTSLGSTIDTVLAETRQAEDRAAAGRSLAHAAHPERAFRAMSDTMRSILLD